MKIMFFVSISERTLMNLGLGYIISALKETLNPEIKVHSLNLNSARLESEIIKRVDEFKPNIVCFSATSLDIGVFIRLAFYIKEKFPHIKIIFGGAHSTIVPERIIKLDCVDAICIGEGEYAFVNYLKHFGNNNSYQINNIWYKNKYGETIKGKHTRFIEKLDSLPFPDKEYLDIKIEDFLNYNFDLPGHLPYLASRGCPLKCTFCSSPAIDKACDIGNYYRLRSPEFVIEEIKQDWDKYRKIGFKSLHFYDPIFGLDDNHFKKLCNLLIREKLNYKLKWQCSTRPEIVTKDWARLASCAGCKIVNLGIESGDDNIRNEVYGKKFSKEIIIKATKNLKKFNIAPLHNYMIGNVWDNKKTIKATQHIIKLTKPVFTKHAYFYPVPKTKILQKFFYDYDFKWEENFFYKGWFRYDLIFNISNGAIQKDEIIKIIKTLRRKTENKYLKNIIKFFKIKDLLYVVQTIYHHIFVVKDVPFYCLFFKSSVLYSLLMEKIIRDKKMKVSNLN